MDENDSKSCPWTERFSLEDLKRFVEVEATVCYSILSPESLLKGKSNTQLLQKALDPLN